MRPLHTALIALLAVAATNLPHPRSLMAVPLYGDAGRGTGTLGIRLTSPTSGVQNLYLDLRAVEVLPASGQWLAMTHVPATTVDLASLGPTGQDLGLSELAAGVYGQIRLKVAGGSLVRKDGSKNPVTVPNGEIKLTHDLTVQPGAQTRLVLDLETGVNLQEARKGRMILRPVLRVTGLNIELAPDGYTPTPSALPSNGGEVPATPSPSPSEQGAIPIPGIVSPPAALPPNR